MYLCFGILIPESLSQQYNSIFAAKCPILPDTIFCQRTKYNGLIKRANNNTNTGIHYSDIPPGQQDLYILKSQVVPPVCPVCPSSSVCPRQTPCQPCPPCARCPEPAFDCKKVPNYASSNDNYLPRPVMNDFSQFGM